MTGRLNLTGKDAVPVAEEKVTAPFAKEKYRENGEERSRRRSASPGESRKLKRGDEAHKTDTEERIRKPDKLVRGKTRFLTYDETRPAIGASISWLHTTTTKNKTWFGPKAHREAKIMIYGGGSGTAHLFGRNTVVSFAVNEY